MEKATKKKSVMWGNMIGFSSYHYKYASGHEGEWFVTGFAPGKNNIAIYIMPGFSTYENIMKNPGKYKTGKSCLYVKNIEDIDLSVLAKLVKKSVEDMSEKYVCE